MTIGDKQGEINMTPLIDVLLVLLIIFLVITPPQSRGLDARLPRNSPDTPPVAESTVVVSIDRQQTIRINRESVAPADLAARLDAIYQRRADKTVFVAGHGDLEYASVANVIDCARGIGLRQVALMSLTGQMLSQ